MTTLETCQRCQGPINPDAIRCPHCDWEPRSRGRLGLLVVLGSLLSMTGVGAIVGVPMILVALYLMHKRLDDKPHAVAPD